MPQMQRVQSSSVDAVGFDPARNGLTTRFARGDSSAYGMVPSAVVDALLLSDSIGRFVSEDSEPRYSVRSV